MNYYKWIIITRKFQQVYDYFIILNSLNLMLSSPPCIFRVWCKSHSFDMISSTNICRAFLKLKSFLIMVSLEQRGKVVLHQLIISSVSLLRLWHVMSTVLDGQETHVRKQGNQFIRGLYVSLSQRWSVKDSLLNLTSCKRSEGSDFKIKVVAMKL